MKSLIHLCTALLADAGRLCSVETARDLETIKSRAQHEGISFLTITLSDFASDFERSLELCQVDSTRFVGWRRRGCLPSFLKGFTSLVFNKNGRLQDEPNSDAVYCIRQVCRAFKKIELPTSFTRTEAAFEKYVQTDVALPNDFGDLDSERVTHFGLVADTIWSSTLGSEFSSFGLLPRHGPGATAERISGNAKYSYAVWNERLERSFPVTEHYFTSVNHMLSDTHGLDSLVMRTPQEELPVRVITVPKTLKAPRIIAIEPVCMQYAQQAVSRFITKAIKRSPLTKESIRFDDQRVNQRMALLSSSDKSYATIDLSEASDRVPLFGVRLMLRSNPTLLEAVEDCRSTKAELPDGRIISLKKFASMGSALCFPIESMYFFTIIVHAILWKRNLLPNRSNIIDIGKRVYIFGDDIIIPSDETDTVLEALAQYNCKVNTTKSFWNGNFRESCGQDAFNGVDVTPIYVRRMCPSSRRSSSELISWIATSNQFFRAGWWAASDFMKSKVERILGSLPVVAETSPGLGWFSFCGHESERMCKKLHIPLVRTFKVRAKRAKDPLDDYPALLKYFLRTEDPTESPISLDGTGGFSVASTVDKRHLALSARCGTVSRKRQWVPAA